MRTVRFIFHFRDILGKSTMGTVSDVTDKFKKLFSWKFKQIEEDFAKVPEKVEDTWQQKRANKTRQFLSRWFVPLFVSIRPLFAKYGHGLRRLI